MAAPGYSYVAYIDEAGDEGFSFVVDGKKGSSEWFVLSAAVTRVEHDVATVRLVDEVRALLGKDPKKALHFRDMKHPQRLPYVDAIAKARLVAMSVLIHKPSVSKSTALQDSERLYFYACRLLLERVSWWCRDAPKTSGDGSVLIVFSNRSAMRYVEFRAYLVRLFALPPERGVNIHWNALKDKQIVTYQAADRKGLQIADAVASSFLHAVEKLNYGYTEARYAEMLKPVVYQRGGNFTSYGVKFMPTVPTAATYPWLAEYLK